MKVTESVGIQGPRELPSTVPLFTDEETEACPLEKND